MMNNFLEENKFNYSFFTPLTAKIDTNFLDLLRFLSKSDLSKIVNLVQNGSFFYNPIVKVEKFDDFICNNLSETNLEISEFLEELMINDDIFLKEGISLEDEKIFKWFIENFKFSKLNFDYDLKEKTFLNIFNQENLFESSIDFLEKQFCFDENNSNLNIDDKITGTVISFIDSIVIISGLNNVKSNELLKFSGGSTGLALNLEYNRVKALVFSNSVSVVVGEFVYSSGYVMKVGVGYNLLGRIINPLGVPLDGLNEIVFDSYNTMERKAPGVITRKKVTEPVITGIKVIDALVPIGRGQRELILGDRKTGKTTIAIDTILSQRFAFENQENFLFCIYVAIGKRMSEIARIVKILKENNSLNYTIIVVARASDPASLQFIAPYVGCTIAEYFTYKGDNSLIIYDDLTKHADVYRQISLLLRRPVGREAYPGDVFFLHSKLLERSVKMNSFYGGGSLTALPIIETIQGDVSAYIPTNVISITDGQIYLDLNKHQEGIRPAVDPGISVSRVGSSAQTKIMKKLASSLKLDLAQYREVEQFSKFGSELDSSTKYLLSRGKLLVNLMKQSRNCPLNLSEQVFTIFLASSKILLKFDLDSIDLNNYIKSLNIYVLNSYLFFPFNSILNHLELNDLDLEWFLFLHYYYYLFKINNNIYFNDFSFYKLKFEDFFYQNLELDNLFNNFKKSESLSFLLNDSDFLKLFKY